MIYLLIFALSAALTWLIRRFAIRHALLDVPNERSSHRVSTPKGGGLAIVCAFYAGLGWLFFHEIAEPPLACALLCALPVVAVSLIDDIAPLSARLRISVQAASAALGLYCLGGVESLNLGPVTLQGAWVNAVALLCIVWMSNLFNFLDGIDGYAGSEALFAGTAAFLLFGSGEALLLGVAAAGFLCFNWHKASIFMGDAGSAPLGFIFALLALDAGASGEFLGWVVLLSLFWFDATVTLWRRYKNGEKLFEAHKKHMYQRLHQSGLAHDRVVLAGMALNMVMFAALCVTPHHLYWIILFASIMLLSLAMRYVDSKKAFA